MKKFNKYWPLILRYLIIVLFSVIIMMPFVWMISTSLKEPTKIFTLPIKWIPDPIVWENYIKSLTLRPFGIYLRNTLFIASLTTLGGFFSASLVGYAFARLKWPGRDKVFLLVIATMMLPFESDMIPQYIVFSKLHWVNTFLPLIVPAFFGGSAFSIFLFRQFFINLSSELEDAAKIDGCSLLGIYWRIALPQSKPAIIIFIILSFRYHWNDFVAPLIYLTSNNLHTLTLGLSSFVAEKFILWNYMMAAAISVMIPMIILFFVAQRYFIKGVVFTGVKE